MLTMDQRLSSQIVRLLHSRMEEFKPSMGGEPGQVPQAFSFRGFEFCFISKTELYMTIHGSPFALASGSSTDWSVSSLYEKVVESKLEDIIKTAVPKFFSVVIGQKEEPTP